MNLIGLLVMLIVIGLLFWGARAIMAAFAVPPQVQTIVTVLLVIVSVLYVLSAFGLGGNLGTLRLTN